MKWSFRYPSWDDVFLQTLKEADIAISPSDREVLRRLAGEVATLAARPLEQEKRDLWYRHNALEPTRPVIFCDPENGWGEIITQDSLECQTELARTVELTLRKEVFWGAEMGDDRVIEPFFNVPHVNSGRDWGMEEVRVGGSNGGSFVWDSPIQSLGDLDRLRAPRPIVDYALTNRVVDLLQDTFGDLLTVRIKSLWWWGFGMTNLMMWLRGLEHMMIDMIDQPDLIHRLMARLRDGNLAMLDYLESNELLSPNNDGTYVGSGGFGWTEELPQPDFDGRVRLVDMWGHSESQETVGISPDMFGEFVLPYQLPVLERFGLNCYGCCELIDVRWHVVKQIPRLRRVSVSPWVNRAKMAELLRDKYVFSMKPNPASLAKPTFDEEHIRADLRKDLRATRDCRVEVLMKDNHTINNDPWRVVRWVQIAREEAESL